MSVYFLIVLICLSFTSLGAKIYKDGFKDGQGKENKGRTIIDVIKDIPKDFKEKKIEKEAIKEALKEEAQWNKLLNYAGDDDE